MIISVKQEKYGLSPFDGDEYIVDLGRQFGGYEEGDMIIYGTPFDCTGQFPLELEISIRKDGSLIFRKWSFIKGSNSYFHIDSILLEDSFAPTAEQADTVAGLFSGRIRFEGLKLAIGASIQEVCPIDRKDEEKKVGRKIYCN